MENNEKNNKKRAPESMEDLISQLFFRDDSEEPKPPLTEETDAAAEEPEAEATPVICDTVVEQGAAVDEAPPEDTAPLPDTDTTAKSAQEEADDVIEYDTPTESVPTAEPEETVLASPEITEVDSAAMEGVREIEKIRSEKNDTADGDEDWSFIGASAKNPFKSFFAFSLIIYIIFLTGLCSVFVWGVNQLVDVYDRSAPERVVDEYVGQLSGATLFNDIAQRIKATKTEFESELSATESALKSLSFEADKRYFLVSESDTGMLYDVFSGNTHLYSLALGKRSEAEIFSIKINFWEIRNVEFIDSCIASAAKTYTVSAPVDADVRINGVKVSSEYITNNNYLFFIGSVWETEVPDIARCVLYTVNGLYGPPTVTATLDGEELEVYVDEDGTSYHVKYPSKWVKDYTVSVPSGASVHVNGVLATKIHSNGKGNDTIFDSGENAKTDVYLIEGLFEKPTVTASFGTVSLGEPTVEGESFTFGYIDEMYRTSYITVPKGAEVKVNGILLNADNSSSTSIPFTELASYAITLNNYMPAELRATTNVKMPEFMRYTVVELYVEPEIEVTLDGISCKQFYEEHGERAGSHMYDFPVGTANESVSGFAKKFAKQYVKYCTEGCYGVNDDIELRKNLYQNWVTYLSYIVQDSLCYDKALESYTDIRYRPIRKVVSEEYDVQNIMQYSDDIYFCRIVCTISRTGDEQPVISFVNAIIVKINGEYKIWSHDTIPA
jgi:hypothetical protein